MSSTAAVICVLPVLTAGATEVKLVDEGVAKCRIVIRTDASATERLAKDELAKYFSRATGVGALDGSYPIELKIDASGRLGDGGFELDVRADGATITGGNDEGLLYGVYGVLKRFAGMRWLTPGDDGEYCVHEGRTISVPTGKAVRKPHLKVRTTVANDLNAAFWHARNGMQSCFHVDSFNPRRAEYGLLEALCVRGTATGGHLLSDLLVGPCTNRKEAVNAIYKAHPEYFPMINGRRGKTDGSLSPNPCISNPKLLDRMAENFLLRIDRPHGSDDYITLGNNDTTVWCQCPECQALDAPEAKGGRGLRADRYWFMVNELAKRIWAKRPDVKLEGWAYQDYWYPPKRVRIDPRLRVLVSFNNQCWRHACDDPACAVNREMVKIYNAWKAYDSRLVVYNRDEIGAWDGNGTPGCTFEPSETVLVKNIRAYGELGCQGLHFCVNTPFPEYSAFAAKWAPYYGKRYHWYAMWQTCYLSAKAAWNPAFGAERALEEANRLYYGAAWDPAMREFRALLTDLFLSAPGCIGWGQGASIGRCLDRPGSEERLVALLGKAVAAAKASGDARALKHVLREKEIFELTWVKGRKNYVENFREMTAYRRTGEIKVDGVVDEADWRNADTYSNIVAAPWRGYTNVLQKTYLRIVYDRDNLYMAVEAMESEPGKMIAGDKVDRFEHGTANLGNHLELFYSYPDMNQATWHLMINSKGQIIDALQRSTTDRDLSIVTKAKWAVKTHPDRWTLEISIPCSEIGQNILDGMTWKVNCARVREVEGRDLEYTSAANGAFQDVTGFVNVKFLARRQGNGTQDFASWKNADFGSTGKANPVYDPGWKDGIKPAEWYLDSGIGGEAECRRKDGTGNDWFVTLRKGRMSQYFFPQAAGRVKIRFKARGKGRVGLYLANYVNNPPGVLGYRALETPPAATTWFDLSEDEWREFSVEREVLGLEKERLGVRFCVGDAPVDIDDCLAYPVEVN